MMFFKAFYVSGLNLSVHFAIIDLTWTGYLI